MSLDVGLFLMPNHPPNTKIYDANKFDLDTLILADQLGFSEAWIGEHFTAPWEPLPCPDILIVQALAKTKNIKLGAGAHLLPYHHPVELAHRIAYIDHLSQGRLLLAIGAGGLPTDATLFNVDFKTGENRKMAREALEILLFLWNENSLDEYKGKYWTVKKPDVDKWKDLSLKYYLSTYQKPHPPIGIAGASPNSKTLELAGEKGFIPMSLGAGAAYLATHWESVKKGAKRAKKKNPSRKNWRLVRDVWIANTDKEAFEYARNGMLSRAWKEYLLPLASYGDPPLLGGFKHDINVKNEDINIEYMLEHVWLVGSPETVEKKIRKLFQSSGGGFGVLLCQVLDHSENIKGWHNSLELLTKVVIPRLSDLNIEN